MSDRLEAEIFHFWSGGINRPGKEHVIVHREETFLSTRREFLDSR